MTLRGSVIPIINPANKLGMPSTKGNERCAIVVAEVHDAVIGLFVDRISNILTVQEVQIQPVPAIAGVFDYRYAESVISQGASMICFLNLSRIFEAAPLFQDAA